MEQKIMWKLITGYISGSVHRLGNLNCLSLSPSTQSNEKLQFLHEKEKKNTI